MLKFFSRLEKTRNFVILIFALLLVASMVFVGASIFGTQTSNSATASSTETVAKVGSDTVTVGELVRQKETLSQFYPGGRAPASSVLLDGMIDQRILRQEAERLGLTASDEELARSIREQNKPRDGKPFDLARYEQNVAAQYGSVKAFEETERDRLSAQKLRAFITSGVTVSEQEVLDDFKKRNTKFDLSYVPVSVADLAATIKPTDAELQDFFNRNKGNYYISEPQKKIRYVFLNTTSIGEKLQIPEADLRAEYDKLPEDRKQAGVQAQQIVLRIAKPEFDTQVLEKANQIVERARSAGGGKVTEQAFAELAQGQSEDPATARNGGKLSGLVRQNPNNPTDPLQRVLTMQEGEITEPIKYGEKYYILRRGATVPKSFEDAKKELEVSLRNRRAYTVAAELAQKVTDDLKQTKNPEATAQKFADEANMTAKEMVRETGFVKPGDEVENIGISPQFEEGIKPLENANDVGEKIPIKDGFAIPMLVEKKEPRDETFEEAKARVAEAVKLERARAQVEQIAKDIAAGAGSVEALAAAAQSKGLKALDSKSFILGSPLGQGPTAATSEELQDAIYALQAGGVTKTPVKVGDNWYVVGVTKREEASMEEFAKQREQLLQSSLMTKREQVFADYLEDIRRRMETSQQIKIYKDALNKVDGLDPTAEA